MPGRTRSRYPAGGAAALATTGEPVCVRRAPDLAALRRDLARVAAAGVSSLAVVLKHAAIYPAHEAAVGRLAREMGFKQVGRRGRRAGGRAGGARVWGVGGKGWGAGDGGGGGGVRRRWTLPLGLEGGRAGLGTIFTVKMTC